MAKEQGEELITQNLVITRKQMDWLQAEGRRRQCSASTIARELVRGAMELATEGSMTPDHLAGPPLAEGQVWECCRPGLNLGRQVTIFKVRDRWVDVHPGVPEIELTRPVTMLRQHFRWAAGVEAKVGYRYVRMVREEGK